MGSRAPISYGEGITFLERNMNGPIFSLTPWVHAPGLYKTDHDLAQRVVLDGLYVKGGQEELDLKYARTGRTIDILLDKPAHISEIGEWPIISFKGCGAVSVKKHFLSPYSYGNEYLIDPFRWHSEDVPSFGRFYGTVRFLAARREAGFSLLKDLDIPHTPYVAINQLPDEVEKEIYNIADALGREPLYQVVRLLRTNIRFEDFGHPFFDSSGGLFKMLQCNGLTREVMIDILGEADARLLKGVLELEGRNQFIDAPHRISIAHCRYITGEFTDFEDIRLVSQTEQLHLINWALEGITDSLLFLREYAKLYRASVPKTFSKYFKKLSEHSGYDLDIGRKRQAMAYLTLLYVDLRAKVRGELSEARDPVPFWKERAESIDGLLGME